MSEAAEPEQIAFGFTKEFALTCSWQASRLRSQLYGRRAACAASFGRLLGKLL